MIEKAGGGQEKGRGGQGKVRLVGKAGGWKREGGWGWGTGVPIGQLAQINDPRKGTGMLNSNLTQG